MSVICRNIIENGDDGIGLNSIKFVWNTLGIKECEDALNTIKRKRKDHTDEVSFFDTTEEKIKTVSFYSPYKEFFPEGFQFSSDVGTYTVKLGNDANYITKTFGLKRPNLVFKDIIEILICFLFMMVTFVD